MRRPFFQQHHQVSGASVLFSSELGRRLLLGAATFLMITMLVSLEWVPRQLQLAVGQPAPRKIVAHKTVKYEEEEKTEQLRANAAELVEPVYDPDVSVLQESLETLEMTLEHMEAARGLLGVEEGRRETLEAAENVHLAGELETIALGLTEKEFSSLKTMAPELVRSLMDKGIRETELPAVKIALSDRIKQEPGSDAFRLVLHELTNTALRANLVYNHQATKKRQQEARDSIQPVEKTVWQDTVIVREGDPITTEHLQVLKALDLLHQRTHWMAVAGAALVVGFFLLLTITYLKLFAPKVLSCYKTLLLLASIAIGSLALGRMFLLIPIGLASKFFPAAAGPLLIAILLDSRLALLMAAGLPLLFAIMAGADFTLAMEAIAGSLAGILAVQKVSQRSDLARAGLFVSGANLCAALSLDLIAVAKPLQLVINGFAGITNGFLAAVLTIGLLPFIEGAFGITTPIRLLELANPNHPLLKRLLLEAPGTYHHSILVGNLAETAADAVKADSLLARVASYYHDVGKIKRPQFFIENQLFISNPHDTLTPSLSALVILSHVKEGLELARQYKLPPTIIDIIEQHHGTTLISYFYNLAITETEAEVPDDNFRYDGPIPQTKEAALVMLADVVEAAVRSLTDPTSGEIEGLIRKVIKARLDGGQLDQSDLTLKDLDRVAEVFVKVLTGIHHHRVPYPEKGKGS
ncbi:MAG TPA: HDIG domain-containing protein [bacterium]|jgi:putative nucleotidyltransferase with HDIG domain|nr:HDIG domain-containing protein [bacterium]